MSLKSTCSFQSNFLLSYFNVIFFEVTNRFKFVFIGFFLKRSDLITKTQATAHRRVIIASYTLLLQIVILDNDILIIMVIMSKKNQIMKKIVDKCYHSSGVNTRG
jgi:hypothetical protein